MTATDAVRVRGTTDSAEIAAVLAAVLRAAPSARPAQVSGYEQWRRTRVAAVRPSLNSG